MKDGLGDPAEYMIDEECFYNKTSKYVPINKIIEL